MDNLYWILLAVSSGAFVGVLLMIVTKEKKSNCESTFRKCADEYYRLDCDAMIPLKDEGAKLANDIASRSFACNSLNKSSPIQVKLKPKITKECSFIEVESGCYKNTPYYKCSTGNDSIMGVGITPKQAYNDWIKAVIQ